MKVQTSSKAESLKMKVLLNLVLMCRIWVHVQAYRTRLSVQKCSWLNAGSVTLVGSGPGDPELLTIAAYKAIINASLVVADRLVSEEIIKLIPCKLVIAGKQPGCADAAQETINSVVIDAVSKGERVVRLKIGDPFLFGRGAEEILEYRKHGIQATVIPGLSSAYSAPMAARISLTHRGVANQVIVCTGYGRNGATVDIPAYFKDSTVVLLMAVGRIQQIASNMMARGYPTQTLVSVVECATTPQQRVLRGTLFDIGEIAVKEAAKAPATIIVGEVNKVLM